MDEKTGAPQCGIYIRIDLPHGKMGEKDGDYSAVMLDTQLIMKTVNEQSLHEKNMHVIEISGGHPESLKIICEVIRAKGFVVVIKDHHETAISAGADGVMMYDEADISSIRKAAGEDFIIGVAGKAHEDADYFSVQAVPQEIMAACAKTDKLCLASGEIGKGAIPSLIQAGATFIDMTHYVFSHKDGVIRATEDVLQALENIDQSAPPTMN